MPRFTAIRPAISPEFERVPLLRSDVGFVPLLASSANLLKRQ